jgi:hypothetical protein
MPNLMTIDIWSYDPSPEQFMKDYLMMFAADKDSILSKQDHIEILFMYVLNKFSTGGKQAAFLSLLTPFLGDGSKTTLTTNCNILEKQTPSPVSIHKAMMLRLLSRNTSLIEGCFNIQTLGKSLLNNDSLSTLEELISKLKEQDQSVNARNGAKTANARNGANGATKTVNGTKVATNKEANAMASNANKRKDGVPKTYVSEKISATAQTDVEKKNSLNFFTSGMFLGICFKHNNVFYPFQSAYHSLNIDQRKMVIIQYNPQQPYGNTLQQNYKIINMPPPSIETIINKVVELTRLPVLHIDTLKIYNGVYQEPIIPSGYEKNAVKSAKNFELALLILEAVKTDQSGGGVNGKVFYKGYYYKVRTESRRKFIRTKHEGDVPLSHVKKQKNKK